MESCFKNYYLAIDHSTPNKHLQVPPSSESQENAALDQERADQLIKAVANFLPRYISEKDLCNISVLKEGICSAKTCKVTLELISSYPCQIKTFNKPLKSPFCVSYQCYKEYTFQDSQEIIKLHQLKINSSAFDSLKRTFCQLSLGEHQQLARQSQVEENSLHQIRPTEVSTLRFTRRGQSSVHLYQNSPMTQPLERECCHLF